MSNALYGKRIAITRAREQAGAFAEKIRAHGGTPILLPTIAFAPLQDPGALDHALRHLTTFDWCVFTSANGVRFVTQRMAQLGLARHALNESRIAAIGPATTSALYELNLRVDFMPSKFLATQVVCQLPALRGESVLLLRANLASEELAQGLAARGVRVTDIDAYQTLRASTRALDLKFADAITFTSSSTVENFAARLDETSEAQMDALDIFCIGPITARTVQERGWHVTAIADEHTTEGLLNVMCCYYERIPENVCSDLARRYAF